MLNLFPEFTPYGLLIDFFWASLFLFIGQVLRMKVKLLQNFFIPASVVAGVIGMLLSPEFLNVITFSPGVGWYPTVLIIILFASVMLGHNPRQSGLLKTLWGSRKSIFNLYAWQYIQFGLAILTGFVLTKLFYPDVLDGVGMCMPAGFAGGYGYGGAVGGALEGYGLTSGTGLGMTFATQGVESLRNFERRQTGMTQGRSGQRQTNLAIILLTAGSAAYAAASLLMRMAGTAYIGTFSKAFIRNLVILLSAAITMYGQKIKPVIRRENYLWMLSRAILGTASALCGYYSIDHLMLADATMLSLLGPMFTVVFSAVLLRERTSPKQKLLLTAAVFGMLLVVKPTWNFSLLFPMLMGIAAAVFYGYTFTSVRLMQMNGEDSCVLVFWYAVLSTIFMLPFLWGDTAVFSWDRLLMVIFSGLISSVTQLFNTKAYGMAPARTLSVYEYTQLPAAAALGWLILGEKPSALSWIGYFVIITASIFMFQSNEKSY